MRKDLGESDHLRVNVRKAELWEVIGNDLWGDPFFRVDGKEESGMFHSKSGGEEMRAIARARGGGSTDFSLNTP